jgi:hypothetical protein
MSSSSLGSDSVPAFVRERPEQWARFIPEGAISVSTEGSALVLRASRPLQERFEQLLNGRKSDGLTQEEDQEYQAICDLDEALSWLNRELRDQRPQ